MIIIPMLVMIGMGEILVLLMWVEMCISTIERRRKAREKAARSRA